MAELTDFILATVGEWGYSGIIIMMALESSFIPFPSEVVMIPAGYLVDKGEMNLVYVLLAAYLGSMIGALVNYFLALSLGRAFLYKYGKYLFMKEKTLDKMEDFFQKHGAISTFTGRLIPGIRQLISIPAGLSQMPLSTFTLYTFLGAALWSSILVALGYVLGEEEALIKEYLHQLVFISFFLVIVIAGVYTYFYQRRLENHNTMIK